jgi:hypothetical protein
MLSRLQTTDVDTLFYVQIVNYFRDPKCQLKYQNSTPVCLRAVFLNVQNCHVAVFLNLLKFFKFNSVVFSKNPVQSRQRKWTKRRWRKCRSTGNNVLVFKQKIDVENAGKSCGFGVVQILTYNMLRTLKIVKFAPRTLNFNVPDNNLQTPQTSTRIQLIYPIPAPIQLSRRRVHCGSTNSVAKIHKHQRPPFTADRRPSTCGKQRGSNGRRVFAEHGSTISGRGDPKSGRRAAVAR